VWQVYHLLQYKRMKPSISWQTFDLVRAWPVGQPAVGRVALRRPAGLQVLNTFDIIKERHMFK
jgi:hypothetical protein